MKKIKTTLHIEWDMPIFDMLDDKLSDEEVKNKVNEHIKKWAEYHKIPYECIKIAVDKKNKR